MTNAMGNSSSPDPDKLKMFSYQVFTKLEGAVTAGMIHLGDKLGLYVAMKSADRPLTSHELAASLELHERWVREWAYNQAAARIIDCDEHEQFSLSPEAAAVLASPERSFEPWNKTFLLPVVLPALDGVADRLAAGAVVADVGCGAGGAVLLMAGAYPKSTFTGYDISQYALDRAAAKLAEAGVSNASFHDPRNAPLATDHSVDFITTFDCIHDMTHPQQMMQSLRAAIKPDGTWLLVDIKAHDTFMENARKNPMAPLMYGISVLSCMSSALSSPDGAGLGTLGFSENTARQMAAKAGFGSFRKLDIDHSVNAFYEVRP